MQSNPFRWLLPLAFAVAVPATQAQQAPSPTAANGPMDPSASVPPLVYRSTLSAYRRLGDDQPLPWREANQTVGRIGGWRAYAREASQAAAAERSAPAATPSAASTTPATPASAPSGAPMPAGHGGHKMH
jgi:hypothetical protein